MHLIYHVFLYFKTKNKNESFQKGKTGAILSFIITILCSGYFSSETATIHPPNNSDISLDTPISIETKDFCFNAYYTFSNDDSYKKYTKNFLIKESDVKNKTCTIYVKLKLFRIFPVGKTEAATYTIIPSSKQTTTEISEHTEKTTTSKSTTQKATTYTVPEKNISTTAITQKSSLLSIDPIPESQTSIDKIKIQQIPDKITSEKERKTYDFTSGESGRYRFELSEVPNNIYFNMHLYNADMEPLKDSNNLHTGGGITYDLKANTLYHIVVEQQENTGSYILNIGSQKPTADISDYTQVSDSIQFTNQRNIYHFTSTESGRYRFELLEIPNNINFNMHLCNSDMEPLDYQDSISNGYEFISNDNGITHDLKANTEYFIIVEQQHNTGSYILNIGSPKPTIDISKYAKLSDSIQFTAQKNVYSFSLTKDGCYRFELSEMLDNTNFNMHLCNSDMKQLDYQDSISNGYEFISNDNGITHDLKANTQYYIVVEQQKNTGKYTLSYGIQKE